jgi:hypothetical protein
VENAAGAGFAEEEDQIGVGRDDREGGAIAGIFEVMFESGG